MAAAGEPLSGELPAWFLELQELLAAAEPLEPPTRGGSQQVSSTGPAGDGPMDGAPSPLPPLSPQEEEPALPWGAGVGGGPACCELEQAPSAELPQLLGPDSAVSTAPEPPLPHGSPRGPGQVEPGTTVRGVKRKRGGGEQQGEQRVRQLSAHNERLRLEVGRLSAEVQRARAALIERVLSLHRA
ncbi:DNA damage-inducible transcript 3 protein-like isoform X1 [Numida meleagris]|uniref:DNA damage-inducible transcript 3 protein-like isoform X1 n=1 Tax=Numida meleagris TaxID=8996 RepID=UPI000B3DE1E0|nr:DNA damage-inducible transcript 3 protein-like isoform X1 [Numida meleagris]